MPKQQQQSVFCSGSSKLSVSDADHALERARNFLTENGYRVKNIDLNTFVGESALVKFQVQRHDGKIHVQRLRGCCIVTQFTTRALFAHLQKKNLPSDSCSYQSRMIPKDFCKRFCRTVEPVMSTTATLLASDRLDDQKRGLELVVSDNNNNNYDPDFVAFCLKKCRERAETAVWDEQDLEHSVYYEMLRLLQTSNLTFSTDDANVLLRALVLDLESTTRVETAVLAAKICTRLVKLGHYHDQVEAAAFAAHGLAIDIRHRPLAEAAHELLEACVQ